MAIFRNMLGGSVSQSNTAVPETVRAAVITSADAKQFGLENVRIACTLGRWSYYLTICFSLEILGEAEKVSNMTARTELA
jgi:hypothetical protein